MVNFLLPSGLAGSGAFFLLVSQEEMYNSLILAGINKVFFLCMWFAAILNQTEFMFSGCLLLPGHFHMKINSGLQDYQK